MREKGITVTRLFNSYLVLGVILLTILHIEPKALKIIVYLGVEQNYLRNHLYQTLFNCVIH